MSVIESRLERRLKADTRRPAWEEPPSLVGRALKALVLTGVVLAVAFPVYVVAITSLSDQATINEAGGLVVVPETITFDAYREILSGGVVTRALAVSVGVTIVGTAFSLALTVLAAYGLSRPGSLLHRPLLFVVLLTFLFGPGMIPTYLLVSSLGLIDSYAALILPTALAGFNLLVIRAFFMNVPAELLDNARIDGAGELQILTRIVLPLSKAVTAVIGLFYAVGYWNAFFNALLYLNDNNKWPMQLVLRTYVLDAQHMPGLGSSPADTDVGSGATPTLAIKMAVVMAAVIPIMMLYPFVQRHFTKGVIIGAIKG